AQQGLPLRKRKRRDQKGQHRSDQPVHKDIIRKPQPAVLLSKGDPLKIDIPDQTAVQKIFVIHHYQHPIGIIFQTHPVEIAKEKQIDLLLIEVGLTKRSRWNMRPSGKNGKNYRDEIHRQQQRGGNSQVRMILYLSQQQAQYTEMMIA